MKDKSKMGMIIIDTKIEDIYISDKDKPILRQLAKELVDYASAPKEQEKINLWTMHNDLETKQPVIFCDPENSWHEIIPVSSLKCEGEIARDWEMILRKEIIWASKMLDDKVISAKFDIPYVYYDSGFGMHHTQKGGDIDEDAFAWEAPLKSYDDLYKIHTPKIVIDYKATNRMKEVAQEVFGDYLDVGIRYKWWWSLGMTIDLVFLRGLETMMMDFYDHPDKLHQLMEKLHDAWLEKFEFFEKNNLFAPNTGNTYVGSGGFGFTKQLPQKDFNPTHVRTIDMWGFCESQETSSVSPEMFGEFIFPYQLDLLNKFGLNCYGCCEPINARWKYIMQIPRLRRVSSSAWADHELMAEQLEDNYIFSYKPNPAHLAVSNMDEDVIRKDIQRILKITKDKGCVLEIIMKDNHTLANNPDNAYRWVRIAREEANNT